MSLPYTFVFVLPRQHNNQQACLYACGGCLYSETCLRIMTMYGPLYEVVSEQNQGGALIELTAAIQVAALSTVTEDGLQQRSESVTDSGYHSLWLPLSVTR